MDTPENTGAPLQPPAQPPIYQPPTRLPNAPGALAVMILGIVAVSFCWFYLLAFTPGIVCGIIALVLAGKAIRAYNANPGAYSEGSMKMVRAGKTCGLIGLILSSAFLLIALIVLIAAAA